jgi:hypothetical protein
MTSLAAPAGPEHEEDPMATAEERMAVLRMLEQGKISAEEAARLLAALGQGAGQTAPPRATPFDTSRSLRVRVSSLVNNQERVNVTLPIGLVRLGLRFIPASSGVDVDEVQRAIDTGITGRIVEVVDLEHDARVEIALE